MITNKEKTGAIIILLLSLSVIITLFLQAPIAQDQNYHHFVDTNNIFGLPNFWNVVSNLPFLFVGLLGVWWLISDKAVYLREIKLTYLILFIAIVLVALGSAYYHLQPNNSTLLWDRLPMTIAFMALFSIIISELISIKLGRLLLLPLLIVGVLSVVYWHFSELSEQGDLRFYILIQFLPILIIPVILIFFTSTFSAKNAYYLLLATYLIAKILEYFDAEIYEVIPLLSGHSLKHIVAAFGIYLLIRSYQRRSTINAIS